MLPPVLVVHVKGFARCLTINKLGCGVAQLVVRRLAVRQALVRFSVRHPTELTSDVEMERNLREWRRMNVVYECDGTNVMYAL
jgi:hypothetical protein